MSDEALIAVCGLPGVGKSTVSAYVTDRLDAVRLRTDAIRKELFDDPEYTDEEDERVYDELLERAESGLADGSSVVLDATFANRTHRERLPAIAAGHDIELKLVRVVCSPEVVEERIQARDDISDADLSVYRQFESRFDEIEHDHHRVDNSESLERTREQVESLLRT